MRQHPTLYDKTISTSWLVVNAPLYNLESSGTDTYRSKDVPARAAKQAPANADTLRGGPKFISEFLEAAGYELLAVRELGLYRREYVGTLTEQ